MRHSGFHNALALGGLRQLALLLADVIRLELPGAGDLSHAAVIHAGTVPPPPPSSQVHPPAASLAVEDEGHELVLDGVLRPEELGVQPPGRGHHCRVGVVVPGLDHQGGPVAAQLREPAGRFQEHREVVEAWHGAHWGVVR